MQLEDFLKAETMPLMIAVINIEMFLQGDLLCENQKTPLVHSLSGSKELPKVKFSGSCLRHQTCASIGLENARTVLHIRTVPQAETGYPVEPGYRSKTLAVSGVETREGE